MSGSLWKGDEENRFNASRIIHKHQFSQFCDEAVELLSLGEKIGVVDYAPKAAPNIEFYLFLKNWVFSCEC